MLTKYSEQLGKNVLQQFDIYATCDRQIVSLSFLHSAEIFYFQN